MLKPQDCMLLIKLLANPNSHWPQRQLSERLGISLSETNSSLSRLVHAGLLRRVDASRFIPIIAASEEFLINGLKYLIPGKLGEYTRGMPTAVGATIFNGLIERGDEPIPIWPEAQGEQKGVALAPIYATIPKSLRQFPDQVFYELLVLIDVIRVGRAREKQIAIKLLKEKIEAGE